jgi:hypothetical protein
MAIYQYTSKSGQLKTVEANSMSEALKKSPDINLSQGGIKMVGSSKQPLQYLSGFSSPQKFGAPAQKAGFGQAFDFGQSNDPKTKYLLDLIKQKAPQLQSTLLALSGQLVKTIESGKVLNPNIELSPKNTADFLKQATKELDPYYKEQIKFLGGDLEESLQNLQSDYETFTKREKENYGRLTQDQANSEAESGTAFSSGREDRQKELASAQQNRLTDFALQAERAAQRYGTTAERTLGSKALKKMGLPTLNEFMVTPEGFSSGGTRKLFNIKGGITGSLQKEREVRIKNRKTELEKAFKLSKNLDLSGFY